MKEITKYNSIYNFSISPNKILFQVFSVVIIILTTLNYIKYNKYYINYSNVISKNKIEFYVNKKDLNKVYKNNKIIINEREFAYTIDNISEPIFNVDYYYKVVLKVDLDKNLNIKNNFLEIKILLSKQTILKYIIKKIGG